MGKCLIEKGRGNCCFKLTIGCCVQSTHQFSSSPSVITIRVTQPFPATIDPEILPCPYLFNTQPPQKSARVHPAVTMTTIRTTWPCKRLPGEVETSGSWKGVSWLGIHLRCVSCRKDGMVISLREQKYRWLACFCLLVACLRGNPGIWPFCPLGKLTADSNHRQRTSRSRNLLSAVLDTKQASLVLPGATGSSPSRSSNCPKITSKQPRQVFPLPFQLP